MYQQMTLSPKLGVVEISNLIYDISDSHRNDITTIASYVNWAILIGDPVDVTTLLLRLPLLIQMFIKVASSPRLSGIGMPSRIL